MPQHHSKITLLDVGHEQYGDCVFCEVADRTILIDGGHRSDFAGSADHPSIPDQLDTLSSASGGPVKVDLLVISHAHEDHIGCVPDMVAAGVLEVKWALLVDPNMAWGHATDAAADAAMEQELGNPQPIDGLLALLREEPHEELTDQLAFDAAADAALKLQARYRAMIKTLRTKGTKVVRHGTDSITPLETEFSDIGLEVLGPSRNQIKACRDIIQGFGRDFRVELGPTIGTDARGGNDVFDLYRFIQQRVQDSADSFKGPGPAINLQSSILVFGDGTHRFLFTGDSQLEDPEVNSDSIAASVSDILTKIAGHAPYDFVKLGHHGSANAFGPDILDKVGNDTHYFGICTGSDSLHHPSRKALDLLRANRDHITWLRTDRNGQSSFIFGGGGVEIEKVKGRTNDLTLPGDEALQLERPEAETPTARRATTPPATVPAPGAPIVVTPVASAGRPAPIEIRIPYIPDMGAQITVHIDVKPYGPGPSSQSGGRVVEPRARPVADPALRFAAGRNLPPLLFVTSERALARNLGSDNAARILRAISDAGQTVLSTLPDGALTAAQAHRQVLAALRAKPATRGVVILGGLDVVPAEQRNTVPASLRRRVDLDSDPDHFIIWSDALYGDTDGDKLQEIPVSRIPDGKSAALMFAALSAPRPQQFASRDGVRNLMRPFADPIYGGLKGQGVLRSSSPQRFDHPAYTLTGDHVYLMLHGDYRDAAHFWGETREQDTIEAVAIENVAVSPGAVVFSGCCWGALTVREPAVAARAGTRLTPRTPQDSLALRFLERGALAFVGCTGVHYSPTQAPYDYLGGPLHRRFWHHMLNDGASVVPAEALFAARQDFLQGIPERAASSTQEAIERKLYDEFTCLGLGW